MTKQQLANSNVYNSVALYFEEQLLIMEGNEILRDDVAEFHDMLATFKDAQTAQNNNPAITVTDKNTVKTYLVTTSMMILRYLLHYANKTGMTDLTAACKNLTFKSLRVSDDDLKKNIYNIAQKVEAYSLELVKYRFTLDKQKIFLLQVKTFADMKPQIDILNTKGTVNTDLLSTQDKKIKVFIKERLNVSVLMELENNPLFVKHYQDLVIIRSKVGSTTHLTINIVKTKENIKQPFVDISIPELSFTGKTDKLGKLMVKTGALKELTVIVLKDDVKIHEEKIGNIVRGKNKVMQIVLPDAPL